MMNTTQRPDYRQVNGQALAVRHLAARQEKHIHARQVDGKLVWLVESQTQPGRYYTVTRAADGWPVDSCDCQDSAYRHACCKHRRAVDLIFPVPTEAPAPAAPTPAPIAWTSDSRRNRKRTEWEEEI